MYKLSIVDTVNEWLEPVYEWMEPIRNWIYEHHNPLLGIAVLVIGMGAFFFLYSALHRD